MYLVGPVGIDEPGVAIGGERIFGKSNGHFNF